MASRWRQIWTVLLLLLSSSELLIVQWAKIATTGAGFGAATLALGLVGLVGANALLFRVLRRRGRGSAAASAARRGFLLASLGALHTGPLLALAYAALLAGDADGPALAFVGGGGAAVAFGFGSIAWGYVVGDRRVKVDRVPIAIRELPEAHRGLVLAHVTDLHIGPQLRAPRLAQLVEKINAQDADLIVITGDIFDYDPAFLEEGCDVLAGLQARHGVYAVLGNHDVYTGADAVAEALARKTSIHVLRDDWTRVDIAGEPLYVLGIDDPGALWGRDAESPALPELVAEVPEDGARVLLMHRPSYFEQVASLGLPLALAGHTHGGQVTLPRPAHHANVSRLLTRYTRGRFELGASTLYVSRGLGMGGPPIRLNCPREIALIELERRP